MTQPHTIDLQVSRGGGLSLRINNSYVSHTMESLVLSELEQLTSLPAARIDANVYCASDPRLGTPAATDVAQWIAAELQKNEIWD
jgi:hypothetical protein